LLIMLQARRTRVWKNRYDISVDGQPLVTWDGSAWLTGGTLELEGRRYRVHTTLRGSTYSMQTEDGTEVASARRVGRKRWMIEADGTTYEFLRSSMWSQNQELLSAGRPVGYVKRTSFWRNDAVAELPGLSLPAQLFALAVILTSWARSQSASPG
jgi:hypothetical protein